MRGTGMRFALFVLLVTAVSGCGPFGPDTYELDEKHVQVEVGEEFTLQVPVKVTMGEWWRLTAPPPDASVVRKTRHRKVVEADPELIGSGKETDFFDFKAIGPGTTKIHLIQCPPMGCVGGGTAGGPVIPSPVPSGSPTPDADKRGAIHTYTVTVRKP